MTADTAVGTVRTYARIGRDRPFDYDAWKEAVRRAETFVTYGPLLEFAVDGQPDGEPDRDVRAGGGTRGRDLGGGQRDRADVAGRAGGQRRDPREPAAVAPGARRAAGRVQAGTSSWLALLVRGHYPDKPEIIAAHSSPVMVGGERQPLRAAADAVTILEQIEGALAYLDTVGTRAETAAYKRMRLVLESAPTARCTTGCTRRAGSTSTHRRATIPSTTREAARGHAPQAAAPRSALAAVALQVLDPLERRGILARGPAHAAAERLDRREPVPVHPGGELSEHCLELPRPGAVERRDHLDGPGAGEQLLDHGRPVVDARGRAQVAGDPARHERHPPQRGGRLGRSAEGAGRRHGHPLDVEVDGEGPVEEHDALHPGLARGAG